MENILNRIKKEIATEKIKSVVSGCDEGSCDCDCDGSCDQYFDKY